MKPEQSKLGSQIIEMFPEGFILLNQELATGWHPELEKILSTYPADDVDLKLSRIASYCAIILDGTYTLEDRDKLCATLAGRLQVMREVAPTIRIQ